MQNSNLYLVVLVSEIIIFLSSSKTKKNVKWIKQDQQTTFQKFFWKNPRKIQVRKRASWLKNVKM